ncbi:MAG: amidase [Sulfitobacter sp.]
MTVATSDYCALAHTLDMGKDGPRVAIKDCIDIKDMVSACGSAALRDSLPAAQNAVVVDTLLAQNCKIVGKTNMHELAYGMTGINDAFGTPINPRWPDRIPGGSSSGSAVAVAAGLCDFAIGTDTGGSVRQPAICCGVFGIKPTYGRVSRTGCHPVDSSLDCVGVFARTAEMLTKGMAAIDPTFQQHPIATPPRIARIMCDADPLIDNVLDASFPKAAPLTLAHLSDAFDAGMTIIGVEAAQAFGGLIEGDQPLGADIRARLGTAREIPDQSLRHAEDIRTAFTNEVDAALKDHDVLVCPALPLVPPTLEDAKDPATVLPLTKMLRPFNLSGHPAIVLPFFAGPDALPAGVQIIGRKGEDEHLCAFAEELAATLTVFQLEKEI